MLFTEPCRITSAFGVAGWLTVALWLSFGSTAAGRDGAAPLPPDRPETEENRAVPALPLPPAKPDAAQTPPPIAQPKQAKPRQALDPASTGPLPAGTRATALAPISDTLGCRIGEPYDVSRLGRTPVDLSPAARLGVAMLSPLADWLDNAVQPAAKTHLGAAVSGLQVSASYVCRTRNNRPGAKLSEHALGNAIDIGAFRLSSGDAVSVDRDWGGEGNKARFLRAVHAAACARFSTVLGPEADVHHKTHFHLDQGRRGPLATYRICQ